MRYKLIAALLCPILVLAGSLKDVKHIIFIMQSGRSFDHYFGTMAGVRGFSDPNYQINSDGTDVFTQKTSPDANNQQGTLLPWHASYLGSSQSDAAQCLTGGNPSWTNSHAAWNNGANDQWALKNGPYSMAYFTRDDIPVHFAIAEYWTVGDMYQESVMSSIDSNRAFWFSGSAGIPGGPQADGAGGPVIEDTNHNPGCHHTNPNIDCYPLNWHPIMKHLQDAGVTWQIYQDDLTAHGQDILSSFEDFNKTKPGDPLYDRGLAQNDANSVHTFLVRAANGSLPQVSWVISQEDYSEQPGFRPQDGAWQQFSLEVALEAANSSNSSVWFISYDNSGGWFDHVPPSYSLNGTAGEWMQDPYGEFGYTLAGPGFRVPFYIVSPWSRGGNVFTEHADHTSQIMFLEQWAQANGYNVTTSEISPWRRQHMSDLLNAFDFNNPDYVVPAADTIPPDPRHSLNANYCMTAYPSLASLIPIPTNQARASALATEQGFKKVRGNITVGRYLVFERNNWALANTGGGFMATTVVAEKHQTSNQQWVLEQYEAFVPNFKMYSAVDKRYIDDVRIEFLGSDGGYSLFNEGLFWDINEQGRFSVSSTPQGFDVYSVSYGDKSW